MKNINNSKSIEAISIFNYSKMRTLDIDVLSSESTETLNFLKKG